MDQPAVLGDDGLEPLGGRLDIDHRAVCVRKQMVKRHRPLAQGDALACVFEVFGTQDLRAHDVHGNAALVEGPRQAVDHGPEARRGDADLGQAPGHAKPEDRGSVVWLHVEADEFGVDGPVEVHAQIRLAVVCPLRLDGKGGATLDLGPFRPILPLEKVGGDVHPVDRAPVEPGSLTDPFHELDPTGRVLLNRGLVHGNGARKPLFIIELGAKAADELFPPLLHIADFLFAVLAVLDTHVVPRPLEVCRGKRLGFRSHDAMLLFSFTLPGEALFDYSLAATAFLAYGALFLVAT